MACQQSPCKIEVCATAPDDPPLLLLRHDHLQQCRSVLLGPAGNGGQCEGTEVGAHEVLGRFGELYDDDLTAEALAQRSDVCTLLADGLAHFAGVDNEDNSWRGHLLEHEHIAYT